MWLNIYLKDDITCLMAGISISTVWGCLFFFFFESHLGDVCSDFQNIFRISEMLSGFCRDLRTVFIVRVN